MATTMTTDVSTVDAGGQAEQRSAWFEEHADELDAHASAARSADVLQLLASQGLLGIGVPRSLGGEGGSLRDAIATITEVAERSLTSGYLFWSQRAFVELLVATGNPWLQANLLPRVLAGEASGATDLLLRPIAAPDPVGVRGTPSRDGTVFDGVVPWASNLRPNGFVLATAARFDSGRTAVVAIPSSAPGVVRSADHRPLGLHGSWTASVRLEGVELSDAWVISDRAGPFLARVRPTLLLLQSALATGVARRAVAEVSTAATGRAQRDRAQALATELASVERTLARLADGPHVEDGRAVRVLANRHLLNRLAHRAAQLELEAAGVHAYREAAGTARRIREAAMLPVIGPPAAELDAEPEPYVDLGDEAHTPLGWAA